MKNVSFTLCVLLAMGLLICGGAQAQPPCTDVDGNGNVSIIDVAELIDGMYVSGDLDAAFAARAEGIDGYEGVTSNDLMSLICWLFINFEPTPPCHTDLGYAYPASNDTLKFADLLVPAGVDTCTVDVLVHALSEFQAIAVAAEYGLGGDDIEFVGTEWLIQTSLSMFDVHDAVTNRLALSMTHIYGEFEAMNSYTPIARLTFVVTPAGEDRVITITPVDWERNNSRHLTLISRLDAVESMFTGLVPVVVTFADNPDEDAHGNFCFGGTRGNIDDSWDQIVDITDLQILIDYQFITLTEPLALGEADVAPMDGADGIVDISDVTAMVDHLFLSLAELPACDECAMGKRAVQEVGYLSTIHEGGRTILDLTNAEELRGLQLVLRGDEFAPVASSPLENRMDLLVGQNESEIVVGLIDLDGPASIPVGDHRVLELEGTYDVISARGATADHITVALSLGVDNNLPGTFGLQQNYPNPFNPTTDVTFSVPARGPVQLVVYNSLGQRVKTLVNGVMDAGEAKVTWDGTDHSGNSVASGVYFYRLTTSDQSDAKKMLLLK